MLLIIILAMVYGGALQCIASHGFGKETGIWIHKWSSKEDMTALRTSKYGHQYQTGEWIFGIAAAFILIPVVLSWFA